MKLQAELKKLSRKARRQFMRHVKKKYGIKNRHQLAKRVKRINSATNFNRSHQIRHARNAGFKPGRKTGGAMGQASSWPAGRRRIG